MVVVVGAVEERVRRNMGRECRRTTCHGCCLSNDDRDKDGTYIRRKLVARTTRKWLLKTTKQGGGGENYNKGRTHCSHNSERKKIIWHFSELYCTFDLKKKKKKVKFPDICCIIYKQCTKEKQKPLSTVQHWFFLHWTDHPSDAAEHLFPCERKG